MCFVGMTIFILHRRHQTKLKTALMMQMLFLAIHSPQARPTAQKNDATSIMCMLLPTDVDIDGHVLSAVSSLKHDSPSERCLCLSLS